MAAKLYTIVYRYMGAQIKTHKVYSQELHEQMLARLKKRKQIEIIDVRVE